MRKFRTILAAVMALALAALPAPVAAMQAAMATTGTEMAVGGIDTEMAAAHSRGHCCPQAEHCDKPAKTGCDHSGACTLKCAGLSANVVTEIDVPALTAPRPERVALAERLSAAESLPQLPPPRL